MSVAPSAFADQFWQHLGPQLATLCTAEARCVAADVETFGGAIGAVVRCAWKHGAGYLPAARWDDIHAWIIETLCEEIQRAETDGWESWLDDNHISGGRVS